MNLPILVHVPAVIMLTFTLLLLCSAVSKKTISFTAIPFRGAFLLFFIHFSSTHLHEEKNSCTWITISWSKSCIFLLSVSLPGWAIELATTFIQHKVNSSKREAQFIDSWFVSAFLGIHSNSGSSRDRGSQLFHNCSHHYCRSVC